MTLSQTPWYVEGKNVKDRSGNPIALFIDAREAERVVEQINMNLNAEEVDDLRGELFDLTQEVKNLQVQLAQALKNNE